MLFHDDSYLVHGGEVGAQSTFKVTHEVDTIYDHVRLQLLGTLFLCDFCKLKKKKLTIQRSMWDLSSPTRDGTHIPCSRRTES